MKSKVLLVLLMIFAASCNKFPYHPHQAAPASYKDTAFMKYFDLNSGWEAGDVGYSIPLKNGKSLWVFGDSYIGNYDSSNKTVPCLFQVRNAGVTMGIASPQNQTTYTGTGSPASLFQVGTNNDYWFWPAQGYADNDTAYIFLGRIHSTGGTGSWAFEGVDSLYVAKMKISTMQVVGYSFLGTKSNIVFNNGMVKDGNFYYIYGIRSNDFGNDLFVARFPANNLYANWQYFTGTGWSTNINKAHKIHSEFTSSFYVFKLKGKYILLTTEFSVGCDQGKEIYAYTSSKPYGVFSNKKTIWTVDDTLNGHYPMFYIAAAHPEYYNGKNEVLITYCINGYGDCVTTCHNGRMDPNVYRPKAIRVPYHVLGL